MISENDGIPRKYIIREDLSIHTRWNNDKKKIQQLSLEEVDILLKENKGWFKKNESFLTTNKVGLKWLIKFNRNCSIWLWLGLLITIISILVYFVYIHNNHLSKHPQTAVFLITLKNIFDYDLQFEICISFNISIYLFIVSRHESILI